MDYVQNAWEKRTPVEWIQQYLDSLTSPSTRRAFSASLLRHLPIFEDAIDKPVYQMNADEATKAMSALSEREYGTLAATSSFMRSFIGWLVESGRIQKASSGFNECDIYEIDTTGAVKEQMFGNVMEILGLILPYQGFTNGNTAVLACLYWYGLTTDEIIGLRATQVDLRERVIHLADRDILLTDRAVVNGLMDYNRTGFFQKHVNRWYACPTGGRFIKRFTLTGDGDPVDKMLIHNAFSKLKRKDPALEHLTVPAIFDSGAYCRLRSIEEIRELTPQDFVDQCRIVNNGRTVANHRAGYLAYRKVFG